MTISDLSQLEALIKLCKKHGVPSIKIDGIEFTLPVKAQAVKRQRVQIVDTTGFDPGAIPLPDTVAPEVIKDEGPTQEQLLFGSADPSVWDEKKA